MTFRADGSLNLNGTGINWAQVDAIDIDVPEVGSPETTKLLLMIVWRRMLQQHLQGSVQLITRIVSPNRQLWGVQVQGELPLLAA